MARCILALAMVVGTAAVSLAQTDFFQPLAHRYSFTNDLTDSVGDADGSAVGDASVLGGYLVLNLLGEARDGRVDLLGNGPDGININTFAAVTIELWAVPICEELTDVGTACTPNPNSGFSSVLGFGKTYGPPDLPAPEVGPTGAAADYIILQTHRGDDVSRGAIAVTSEETLGAPWGAETGVNGSEYNDTSEHHYALVIDHDSLEYFVDGLSMGTAPLATVNSHGNSNSLAGVSNLHAWIGSAYEIDPNWSGAVNELRIWDFALPDYFIAESYHAGPNSIPVLCLLCPEPGSLALLLLGSALALSWRLRCCAA